MKPRIIYGDAEEDFSNHAWQRKGRVSGIDVFGTEILITHQLPGNCSHYHTTLLHGINDGNPVYVEHPSSYNVALFDNHGGICLFCLNGVKPMRHYRSFTDIPSGPNVEITLPGYYSPCFSRNGKYLSVYSIASIPGKMNSAWLIDTSTWQPVDEVIARKNMIWSAGFSNDSHYWLVSSDKPMVISVPE